MATWASDIVPWQGEWQLQSLEVTIVCQLVTVGSCFPPYVSHSLFIAGFLFCLSQAALPQQRCLLTTLPSSHQGHPCQLPPQRFHPHRSSPLEPLSKCARGKWMSIAGGAAGLESSFMFLTDTILHAKSLQEAALEQSSQNSRDLSVFVGRGAALWTQHSGNFSV